MTSRTRTATVTAPPVSEGDVRLRPYSKDDEYRLALEDRARQPEMHPSLIIEYRGLAIGYHQLYAMSGDQAEFYTRFWDPTARSRGVASVSVIRAAQHFFETHPQLQRLVFRSSEDNPMSARTANPGIVTRADFEDQGSDAENWDESDDDDL